MPGLLLMIQIPWRVALAVLAIYFSPAVIGGALLGAVMPRRGERYRRGLMAAGGGAAAIVLATLLSSALSASRHGADIDDLFAASVALGVTVLVRRRHR